MAKPRAKIHCVTVCDKYFSWKTKHKISVMAGNCVYHSVFNGVAGLQEIVYCNQVHIHIIEIVPQG